MTQNFDLGPEDVYTVTKIDIVHGCHGRKVKCLQGRKIDMCLPRKVKVLHIFCRMVIVVSYMPGEKDVKACWERKKPLRQGKNL